MAERPIFLDDAIANAGAVLPLNLQYELQDLDEVAGAPGMVLTSLGPGQAPRWVSLPSVPAADRGFLYQQAVASDHWEIDHGFLYRPAVTITDVGGEEVTAAISHPASGITYVDFNFPLAGIAWCV